jgi:hypothetical protein
MKTYPTVEQLYTTYSEKTGKVIENDFFESVLLFFPAISIVACDDVIDEEEWLNLDNLTEFMSRSHRDRFKNDPDQCPLKDVFTEHINFLAHNIKFWEPVFLNALKVYLQNEEQFKELVYEVIETFAELSDGISETEEKKIETLSSYLELR